MTTYYSRVRTILEVSAASDYEKPIPATASYTSTPNEYISEQIYEVGTTAQTFRIDHLDTVANTGVKGLLIENKSSDYYVEAEWYYEKGSRAAGNLAFTQGTPDKIEDQDDGDFTITPSFAEAGDWVFISAVAEDSANQSQKYLIQSIQDKDATYDEITLAQDSTITTNADDDTAVLHFWRKNKEGIIATGHLFIGTRNLVASQNLVLKSVGGTSEVKISYIGT